MRTTILTITAILLGLAASQTLPCTYTTSNGKTVDLSSVPVSIVPVTQIDQGIKVVHNFTVSLCKPANHPPGMVSPCSTSAYVSEYSATQCINWWDQLFIPGWTYNASSGNGLMEFMNAMESVVYVEVGCGPQLELKADGPMTTGFMFAKTLKLTTSAACTFPTKCDVQGSTVSQLAPKMLTINVTMDKWTTTYEFAFGLCSGTQIAPPDATACSTSGFIGVFRKNLINHEVQCLQVYDRRSGFYVENSQWFANYTSSQNQWTASVVGLCGTNTEVKSIADGVTTSIPGGKFNTKFTLMAKAFCLTPE